MSEYAYLKQETQEQQVEKQTLAQVNQVISNAVAALMDVSNLLRDIPKLVVANQQLSARVQELESKNN
jgi:hypothetical protein